MKSQFEQYIEEDCKQFNKVCNYYRNKNPEDIDTLYALTTECLMLSARWSDIASNASMYAKTYGMSKTDFQQWAYQRYRTLQEMHVDCRVFFKDAKEDLQNFGRVENV